MERIPYRLTATSWWKGRLFFPPIFHVTADSIGYLIAPNLLSHWYRGVNIWDVYPYELLYGSVGLYAISEANFWTYLLLDRIIPWENGPQRRLTLQLVFEVALAFIVGLVVSTGIFMPTFPNVGRPELESVVVLSVLYCIFASALFFGIYTFQRVKQSLLEAELLKRENLVAQNQALRQQIDPHFLFNSITTLTSLITDNRDQAIEFLRRLAKVYRHVLASKEYDLIPLQSEVEFVRDYVFAFEMRFGGNFRMVIDLPDSVMDTGIPPLTLQILVENAVKHNAISAEMPLTISIGVEGTTRLVVRNNLQRKPVHTSPTHIGLNNILARYRYVTEGIVEVLETEHEFIVRLPLIRKGGVRRTGVTISDGDIASSNAA